MRNYNEQIKEKVWTQKTVDMSVYGESYPDFLEEIKGEVEEILESNPGLKEEDISISLATRPVPYESYDEEVLVFSFEIEETEEEFQARLKYLEEEDERQEKEDRKKFEELKNKYGW